MTLAITFEQSWAIMLAAGIGSMMYPIMMILIRIYNARNNR